MSTDPKTPTTDQQSDTNQSKEATSPETATAKEANMPDTRVVPNWGYVLAAKFGAKDAQTKKAIQENILDNLQKNPEGVSFADEETAKASPLGQTLARLPLSFKGSEKPAMFRLLSEQIAANAEHATPEPQADKAKDEAAMKAKAAHADAEIAKANATAARKAAEKQQALDVLQSLGTAPKSEAELTRAAITELIRGFVLGHACVDQDSRPGKLVLKGKELEVLFGSRFVDQVARATKGGEAKSYVAMCPWCGKGYGMGEQGMRSQPVFEDKKMKRDERNRPVFADQPAWLAQVLYLPCRNADGSKEYVQLRDDEWNHKWKAGDLKKLPTLCCYDCKEVARKMWEEVSKDRVRSAKDKARKDGKDEKAAGDVAYKAAKQDGPNASGLYIMYGKWAVNSSDGPGRTVYLGPEPDDRDPTAGQPTSQPAPRENPRAIGKDGGEGERTKHPSKSAKSGTHGHTEDDGVALAGHPMTHDEGFTTTKAAAPTLTHSPFVGLTAASRVASSSDPDEVAKE